MLNLNANLNEAYTHNIHNHNAQYIDNSSPPCLDMIKHYPQCKYTTRNIGEKSNHLCGGEEGGRWGEVVKDVSIPLSKKKIIYLMKIVNVSRHHAIELNFPLLQIIKSGDHVSGVMGIGNKGIRERSTHINTERPISHIILRFEIQILSVLNRSVNGVRKR